ncbi:MAG: hypothetical protein KH339_08050 [Firmicutes bacterium]|nr:hypothetical protein [Bacillota bacterium]
MQKQAPKLVIMAAGMGSRFGGLKQMEPVDREGHSIIDFSMYDARRAGFRDLVFIIKREHEALFRERIGTRMERFFHVEYVYQELTDIPAGYSVPDGRVKPWGTGQAVACCRNVLHGPFAVINSDDFYGRTAFSTIYEFLRTNDDEHCYAMVGYRIENTLTENGHVARGVCETDENGFLRGVTERTRWRSRGLVAGWGHVGRTLAARLKALGAEVCVLARSPGTRAWIEAEGLECADAAEPSAALAGRDIVINTVPAPMLTASRIAELGARTLILDLASAPGGTDFDAARAFGIRALTAPGLPGKWSPQTAAEAVRDAVYNILEDEKA